MIRTYRLTFKNSRHLLLLVIFLLIGGCASSPQLATPNQWQPDGSGNYVHKNDRRVISKDRYVELVASEARGRIRNLTGGKPNHCVIQSRN